MSAAAGERGEGLASLRRLKPGTRRGWGLYVIGLAAFSALDVLALMGVDLALRLLVSLSGLVLGAAAAYALARPFRGLVGVYWMLAIFVGLALTFVIIFGGSALAGVPAFPTAESGNVGLLIYGFAFGFGVFVPGGLGFSGTFGASDLRALGLALGVVAALFALLFAAFVLIEYLAAPLIRHLAG